MSPGGNMNPMMPGGSMTGSSSGSRNAGKTDRQYPLITLFYEVKHLLYKCMFLIAHHIYMCAYLSVQ